MSPFPESAVVVAVNSELVFEAAEGLRRLRVGSASLVALPLAMSSSVVSSSSALRRPRLRVVAGFDRSA